MELARPGSVCSCCRPHVQARPETAPFEAEACLAAGLPGPFGRPSTADSGEGDEDADAPAIPAQPVSASAAAQLPPLAAEPAAASSAPTADPAGEPAAAVDDTDEAAVCASVFRGLVFFVAREAPREAMMLVVRAFGGQVGWQGEGSPLAEDDPSITHQVRCMPSASTTVQAAAWGVATALPWQLCPCRLLSSMAASPFEVVRPCIAVGEECSQLADASVSFRSQAYTSCSSAPSPWPVSCHLLSMLWCRSWTAPLRTARCLDAAMCSRSGCWTAPTSVCVPTSGCMHRARRLLRISPLLCRLARMTTSQTTPARYSRCRYACKADGPCLRVPELLMKWSRRWAGGL